MRNTPWGKVVLIVAVLLAFGGYIQFSQFQSENFEVDEKTFHVKQEFSGVMANYYGRVTGLETAHKYKIVNDLKRSIPVPYLRRTLELHKLWLQPNGAFLLYSFDLLEDDKKLNDVPKIDVGGLTLHMKNGDKVTTQMAPMQPSSSGKKRVTYNRNLYGGILLSPVKPFYDLDIGYDIKNFMKYFKQVKTVTLNDVVIKVEGEKKKIGSIDLQANFRVNHYFIAQNEVNKTIKVSKDFQIDIGKFKRYYNRSMLLIDSNNEKLLGVTGKISGNKQTMSLQLNYFTRNSFYVPNQLIGDNNFITLSPEYVLYTNDDFDPIKAEVTKKQIKSLISGKNDSVKIGEIPNGTIHFGYNKKQKENLPGESFYINIKFNPNKYPHVTNSANIIVKDAGHEQREIKKDKSKNVPPDFMQNNHVITIKHKSGAGKIMVLKQTSNKKSLKYYFLYRGIGPKKVEGFTISISALPYIDDVEGKPLKIKVPVSKMEKDLS